MATGFAHGLRALDPGWIRQIACELLRQINGKVTATRVSVTTRTSVYGPVRTVAWQGSAGNATAGHLANMVRG